ncbi:hypothetical protein W02_38180 [Nitrospira sp. KM1]|uniref:tyrosine-type recombinase/integrase n=1 Tax=Nitrospira sp. KM1 TaxID=1936990 RepID=UPI0013A75D1A|nr:tyrosine-type recombinase/integrase [Nitrospira sp. KM1]BCA56678.1 hypothetical protein W02_38180 [Nitrospira sp. KM1]
MAPNFTVFPTGTPPSPQTIGELLLEFDRRHLATLKYPHSTRSRIAMYFPPLHPYTLDTLTRPLIKQWFDQINAHSSSQACACLKHLHLLYNKCLEWGRYHGLNPAYREGTATALTRVTVAPLPAPSTSLRPGMTIGELLEQYYRLHISTLKGGGRGIMTNMEKHFGPLKPYTLESLTVAQITEWINPIRANIPSMAIFLVKKLRHLYNWAEQLECYDGKNRAMKVPIGTAGKRKEFVREHEMPTLLDILKRQPLRERCFFMFMLTLFPRPGEAAELLVSHLQFWTDEHGETVGMWHKVDSKTQKIDPIDLPPVLASLLVTYIRSRPKPSTFLFPGRGNKPLSVSRWTQLWHDIRKRAGVDRITRHDLRRTGSTWAVDTSKDLVTVSKKGLGHTNFKTTSIYVQAMDSSTASMYRQHEARLLNVAEPRQAVMKPPFKTPPRALGSPISSAVHSSVDVSRMPTPDPVAVAPVPSTSHEDCWQDFPG